MYIEVWHAPHTHRQQHHSATDVKYLQPLPQPQLVLHHALLILLRICWRKYNLCELYPGYTSHHSDEKDAQNLKYCSKWSVCATLFRCILPVFIQFSIFNHWNFAQPFPYKNLKWKPFTNVVWQCHHNYITKLWRVLQFYSTITVS